MLDLNACTKVFLKHILSPELVLGIRNPGSNA